MQPKCTHKILPGCIYFMTLDKDNKKRPYLIVSDINNVYGTNLLAYYITSNFNMPEATIPIIFNNRTAFIRYSGPIEIMSAMAIKEAEFNSGVDEDLVHLLTAMHFRRYHLVSSNPFITIRFSEIDKVLDEYLTKVDKAHYPIIHDGKTIPFNKKKFLSYTLMDNDKKPRKRRVVKPFPVQKKNLPYYLKDWDIEQLKRFREDMYHNSMEELQSIYESDNKRIIYLKKNVKAEMRRRRVEREGVIHD